ncbi:unnamed protein product, partial [Owenia fusiformis]
MPAMKRVQFSPYDRDISTEMAKRAQEQEETMQDQLKVTESGKGVKVQSEMPHLVSLGGGRLSTAVTLLPLPLGSTTIGTVQASRPQDIVLQGEGLEDEHCCILHSSDNRVVLHPVGRLCSIDGILVNRPTQLTQGCMLCLGTSTYLRFNHPTEAARMKSALPLTYHAVPATVYAT